MEWKIQANLSPEGKMTLVRLSEDEKPDNADVTSWGPVDHLVASVAGCFVKSVHMVQQALGQEQVDVRAIVVGAKADAKPARIGSILIRYEMPSLPHDKASKLAQDAKRICTVTNSLNCDFDLQG